jgi:hypothetical protein
LRNTVLSLAAIWVVVTACAAPAAIESASTSTAVTPPSASSTATEPLVGEWIGVHECDRIVEALRIAGFDESVVIDAVVGNALVPDATSVDDLADPANPCADAVPREHGHFFTASGVFGSTDHNGEQVDDGTYDVVDGDTLSINGTEFGYAIDGDSLTLQPIVADGCVTFECGWSIMVAMAGEPLERSR